MSRNESSKDVDFLVEDLWLEYKVEFLFVSWNLSHIRCSGALPPPYIGTGDFSLLLGILPVCGHVHVRSHVSLSMD